MHARRSVGLSRHKGFPGRATDPDGGAGARRQRRCQAAPRKFSCPRAWRGGAPGVEQGRAGSYILMALSTLKASLTLERFLALSALAATRPSKVAIHCERVLR